jgi:hypothetical protein
MANPTAADQPAKAPKPFVFPDMNDYVVPSVELLLISGFAVILLNEVLGWNLFSRDAKVATQSTATTAQANAKLTANALVPSTGPIVQSGTIATSPAVNQTVVSGTHRALCSTTDQGLNFRPTAGFSTPLFAIPCGAIVNVTGSAVNVQNEAWSPVNYGGRNGWSATKLLQPLR